MPPKYDAATFRRKFLEKVGSPDERGCTEWTGAVARGYGKVAQGGTLRMATHVALELFDGLPVLPGTVVMHSCDNPPCVNPTHLRRGTVAENAADAMARGQVARGERHSSRTHPERMARGDRHGTHTHPEQLARGEANVHAKLTEADVIAIRTRAATGETYGSLSTAFHISRANICLIVNRKAWRHVA